MIIIRTKHIKKFTFKGVVGIALFPFIIVDPEAEKRNPTLINHEMIHIQQQKELLVIGFYILYLLSWLKNLVKYRNFSEAYYQIPFEREAYGYEHVWNYLDKWRKPFASVREYGLL